MNKASMKKRPKHRILLFGINRNLKCLFLIFILNTAISNIQAQDQSVSGIVTNDQGQPVIGATVVIKGTTEGAITDSKGSYSLSNVAPGATLYFSCVGMTSIEIPVEGRTEINLSMTEDILGLDEVVVVGYSTLKRKNLTSSVSSVKGKVLSEMPGSSAALALQGRTAGVVVQPNSGSPGADLQIRIRGTNSIHGGNEPLWVIDGFPVPNANLINLNDIESIDILKDASASAIYGARGANGVIIVTTKRGRVGKTKVSYNGSFGLQKISKHFDMLNAQEYMQLMNTQYYNDFGIDYFSEDDINNATESIDWQNLVYRVAQVHDHSLNISGGSQKTKFSLGTSYFDQEGIITNTDYKRITVRNNIEHKINNIFNLSFNAILSRTQSDEKDGVGGLRGGSLNQSSFAAPPTVGPYNDDDSYRELMYEYAYMPSGFVNPVAYVNEVNKGWYRNKVMSNITLNITPIQGLVISTSGNIHNTEYRYDRFTTLEYPRSTGSAGITCTQVLDLVTNNTIRYSKSDDKHNFSILAGTTYEYESITSLSASGTGYINDILETYELESASIPGIPSSSYSDYKMLSFIGSLDYSFDDKYIARVTFRADGCSKFSPGEKWGYFPGVSAAWRISDEEFMEALENISDMKIRVGYGVVGNPSVPAYGTINYLTTIQSVWDKETYAGFDPRNTYPGNLHWERSAQTDIGIDANFFHHRVGLSIVYYKQNINELLNSVPLPPSSGYTSTKKNIGSMENKGLEIQVDAKVLDNSFNWDISTGLAFNKNRVVELSGGQDIQGSWYSVGWMGDYINLIREGEPFGVFYGYKEVGYDENGMILYENADGESVLANALTSDDKTIIGDPNPDLTYSITSKMKYKRFSLNIFLQGVQGRDIYSISMGSTNNDYGWGLNTFTDVLYNHWTPDNTDAKYPKITSTHIYQVSDRFVYDGSYLRLKNIELAYSLPMKKMGAYDLTGQVYISGQNLYTFSSYPWWDPEVNSRGGSSSLNQGIDHFSYPSSRSVMLGVRLEF